MTLSNSTLPIPRRFRDLTLLPGPGGTTYVVACDSVGGIGQLQGDSYQVDNRTVAHFGARVPLLELICARASPLVIVNTLSLSRASGGDVMIAEFQSMAEELSLDPAIAVTGSTEDNVTVSATGFGVTVIGQAQKVLDERILEDDAIYCIGLPLSAPHDRLRIGDERMPSLDETRRMLTIEGVRGALPVGSRGIRAELTDLLGTSNMSSVGARHPIDELITAGPSSCVLVAAHPSVEPDIRAIRASLPVTLLAIARPPKQETEQ